MSTTLRLLRLMAPVRWWIALGVLLSFGTLGASVGLMAMSAYLISKAALVPAFADIAVVVTAVRFFAIARAALRYAERYITHLATFRILAHLRVWFYTAIEPLAPARLQEYHSGDLFARIGADIETLENFYVRVIIPPLAAALVIVLTSIIMGAFDMQLALVTVAFLLLTGVALPVITQRISRGPAAYLVETRAALDRALVDQIHGVSDLMAFGQERKQLARIAGLGRELDRVQLTLAQARAVSGALTTLFASLAGLTVLMLAIPLVTSGQIEGVFLALLPLTAIAAFEALQPLGVSVQQYEASRAAARRLFELIDALPRVQEPAYPLPKPTQYDVVFNDVSFGYSAPDGNGREALALDKVTFEIPQGAQVAVVGESGAGKTSLVNLLVRFWEPNSGQLLVAGQDIRAFASDDVRALCGVVSQHTFLFNGTLRDNLLLAKGDATDEELNRACERARLSEFVRALPLGLDTLVGENGLKLSGGERQRIAVARVILKDAPILILDEATANLDAVTEYELMSELEAFMQDRTTLIISHRRSGFEGVEHLVTLEHGRVQGIQSPVF